MLKSLLMASIIGVAPLQEVPPASPTGVVAGSIALPVDGQVSQPVQVVLLSPQYANLWDTDVQRRLDTYWERYKPAFIQNKESFLDISRRAQIESLDYVIGRIRRDQPGKIGDYVRQATTDGKFEFTSIPFGEYKILAVGKLQNVDVIWQGAVDVRSAIPQFLELKKPLP